MRENEPKDIGKYALVLDHQDGREAITEPYASLDAAERAVTFYHKANEDQNGASWEPVRIVKIVAVF